mgnify:CR=1 FL=1
MNRIPSNGARSASNGASRARPATPEPGPFLAVIYGVPKRGKTASALRCIPDAYGITATRDALACLYGLTRIRPREHVVDTLKAAATAAAAAPAGLPLLYDDVTVWGNRSQITYERRGVGGWELWGALQKDLLGLREVALERETTAVFVLHERGWEIDKKSGAMTLGGPLLPSRKLTEAIPGIGGIVVRAVAKGGGKTPLWGGGYECDPLGKYLVGDRYGVVPKLGPQALREIVVAANRLGHPVAPPPRPRALEWMEDVVEWLATGLTAGGTVKQAVAALAADSPAMPSYLRAWCVEDAYARALYAGHDPFAAFGSAEADGDDEADDETAADENETAAAGDGGGMESTG